MPRGSRPFPFLLLVPFFTALFVFWLIPLVRGFSLSLQSDDLFGETTFVGLTHYRDLFHDARFWHALRNTFIYCGWILLLVLPLALLLAHGLRRALPRFRGPIQFCLLLPGLTPPLVLAILYLMVFNGPHGLLNHTLLTPVGLPNVDWIRDPRFIKLSLALLALWRWTGFITLIFLSGLEGIPRSYYDAARAEGASPRQLFLHVTLPLLRPVTVFVAAFLFLDAFALFEGAYVLLGGSGGTLDAGLLLVSYSYLTAFTLGNFGSAAAMAFTSLPLLMITLWFILAQGRFGRRAGGSAPSGLTMSRFRKHGIPVLTTLVLAAPCLVFAFPFLWMFFASFKPDAAILIPFPLLPRHFDLRYYHSLFSGEWIPYSRQFLNSLFIACIETLLATGFTCCAGYVFAKFDFRFKRLLFTLGVLAVLVPRQVLVLPLFMWMNRLSLLDTPWSVILPGAASGIGMLYFTAVFRRVPDALLDMARCEGAGEYRVFLSALPLVKPALIAFALIQFVLCWQEHLVPLVMLSTNTRLTVTIGLASLNAGNIRVPYGLLLAGCTLTLLPTALFFILAHRHFRSALGQLTEA